ncbi:MAG TPA: hypothetical protein DCX07_07230 [Phycisphaerales bacterium]|nr:hypothetical protein [Phycisphaerales bacterium]
MGHYCWVCGRTRANERFSGKGHARHICRDCARLPKEERDRAQALIDIERFLRQSNISAGNVARLKRLCGSSSEEVRRKAALVLEVALAKPGKRRRWGFLARTHPSLLDRLREEGLLPDYALSPWQAGPKHADGSTYADDGRDEGGKEPF